MEIDGIRALIEMVGDGNGEEITVAADALAERAKRMAALCVSLQWVSAAIIAGAIDESSVFDRLLVGEETEVNELVEAPRAQDAGAADEAKDHAGAHTEAGVADKAVSTAEEPVAEEPGTEIVIEGYGPELSPPEPKRKRTRASS